MMNCLTHGLLGSSHSIAVIACACILFTSCTRDSVEETVPPPGQETSTIQLEVLDSAETGITFNNLIRDAGNLNVFVWNFLYSGGGVATGDINNDGLPDIYFAGNQVPDQLYLNKGNFTFQNITESAGIHDNQWSTGVTMADVNADGLLDIYVCKNSPLTREVSNLNRLYINQGDNTFLEEGAAYGLADPGFSIQATFFDVDNDDDLDMYLVNQPVDQFAKFVNPPDRVNSYPATDRLFIAEKGRYIDRTSEIIGLTARYGLGISLMDLHRDGWTDIYVCNDYHHADHLWINEGGRLSDQLRERTGHISFYSMGSDEGDINNDGYQDLAVLDMAFGDHYRSKTNMESMNPERFWGLVAEGQHYQYAQNTLLLNKTNGKFSDIAQLSGVSKTDWSWTPLFVDLDHDGLLDMLVTNGIYRDMKNNDFTMFVAQKYGGQVGPSNYREVLDSLPSSPVSNILYKNLGRLQFEDQSAASGFDLKGFSHGMAYADFDRDGKLDIVLNNMNAPATVYRNVSKTPDHNFVIIELRGEPGNAYSLGATVTVSFDGKDQTRTMQTTRGYFSSSEPLLHFGLGAAVSVDSVTVTWNHREQTVVYDLPANERHIIEKNNVRSLRLPLQPKLDVNLTDISDRIDDLHREIPFDDYRDQVLLPYKLSQNGPSAAAGDLNGDGRQDVVIGGAAGQPTRLFIQDESGRFVQSSQEAFRLHAGKEDGEILLFDVDNDNDLDVYIACGSNEHDMGDPRLRDVLYTNDGTGILASALDRLPGGLMVNGKAAAATDLDGDDDLDLFVAGRLVSGKYPLPANSAILMNNNGIFTEAPGNFCDCLDDLGLVTGVDPADYDNDGDIDFVVVGEWMAITLLENQGSRLECIELEDTGAGLWWSVASGDFDGDGDQDFIAGNLGWNHKFGSSVRPKLEVYAGDLDNNGDHDVVLAKDRGEYALPVRGRECSSEELPFVLDKFPTFDRFARADLGDILADVDLGSAYHAKISTYSTMLFLNDGQMEFTPVELPVGTQTGPVKALMPVDIDLDGDLDCIYAGNHYQAEVETARYDGLLNGVLINDGSARFTAYHFEQLGIDAVGDFRDVIIIESREQRPDVLLTRNDGRPLLIDLSN